MVLKKEISSLRSNVSSLESALETRNEKITSLEDDLRESEDARRRLKLELEEMSAKMVLMDEHLYKSKSLQLELLENIKILE